VTTAPPPTEPSRDHPGPALGYPAVLTVAGHRCLVVGAGPVAARRARGLLDAGAMVTVVAPEVAPETQALATEGNLEIVRRRYRSGEAARFHLVLTATGVPEVDRSVVADAVSAGVLVNSADGGSPGTMQLPAVHRQGPVVLAVSTTGTSPSLARWLADRLGASLPADVAVIAELLEEARAAVRASGRSTTSVDWQATLSEQVVPLVEAGRTDEARAVLRQV
jgi:precorrin-2 dehydrogenase/sirohydrochlorin ferrochelatase